MTLKEAIESGKRFTRPGDPCWYVRDGSTRTKAWIESDVLATDWEIEEETVTITKRDVAWSMQHLPLASGRNYDEFFKSLGFK